MKYTINATVFNDENGGDRSAKGFATVVFGDSFKVTNIAIIENKTSKELFVSMPRYLSSEKDQNGNSVYKDVCNPITKEFREELYTNILKTYEMALESEKAVLTIGEDISELPFKASVYTFEREGSPIRGLAKAYFDNSFVINNINVLQGSKGLFVTMPSYKTKQVDENGKHTYQDICYPITKEFRSQLFGEILDVYDKQKNRSAGEPESFEEHMAHKETAVEMEKDAAKKNEDKKDQDKNDQDKADHTKNEATSDKADKEKADDTPIKKPRGRKK